MTKLELLSNATTIDHALEYIRSKQDKQPQRSQQRQQEQSQSVF